MERGSTIFLRGAILLIGLIVLGLCVFALPAGIRFDTSGYYRPILLGLYVTAVPFYMALYQTLRLLDYIDQNNAFSEHSVKALMNIKHCAIAIGTMFTAALPYVYMVAKKDAAPSVLVIGLVIALASFVVAVFAAVLQKLLKNAIDIKSENDLTV